MQIERAPRPERSSLLTPARISAAAARMRRKFSRSCHRADALLGERSAAWDALRRRIEDLVEITRVEGSTAAHGVHVSRLMLDLKPAGLYAARVQVLALALLGLAQAIEAEDATARLIAADLAGIVADADLIVEGIEHNRAELELHNVDEIDESVETEPDDEDLVDIAA